MTIQPLLVVVCLLASGGLMANTASAGGSPPAQDEKADPSKGSKDIDQTIAFPMAQVLDAAKQALAYMDLVPGTAFTDVSVDTVFIGSCTNGRLEDLRAAAEVLRGRRVASGVRVLVVPGSAEVKLRAEAEGLQDIFQAAGAEWRGAGCSMCLAMNPDRLEPGQRSASTSNRNFEGRQGKGGRTHLVSVPVAAATAVRGTLSSPADLESI